MKKQIAVWGLALCAVAAPAAMATTPGKAPAKPVKPAAVAKPKPVVSFLFKGVALADATAEMVEVSPVMGTNAHARKALAGATAMTVKLAPTTVLRSRVLNADGTKSFLAQTVAEIKAGDVVFFHVRAKKGTALADLPAAKWLRDFTPAPAPAPAPVPAS